MAEFNDLFWDRDLLALTRHEVEGFILRLEAQRGLFLARRANIIAALRFFYRGVFGARPSWEDELFSISAGHLQDGDKVQHAVVNRRTIRIMLPLIDYEHELPAALIYGFGL